MSEDIDADMRCFTHVLSAHKTNIILQTLHIDEDIDIPGGFEDSATTTFPKVTSSKSTPRLSPTICQDHLTRVAVSELCFEDLASKC